MGKKKLKDVEPTPKRVECLPFLVVGKFLIASNPVTNRLYIRADSGEGGEFSLAKFEDVIEEFFWEHF